MAKRSFYAEYREKEGRLTIPLCSYTGITCDITSMSFPFAKTSLPFASVSGIPAEHSGSVTRIQVPAGGLVKGGDEVEGGGPRG